MYKNNNDYQQQQAFFHQQLANQFVQNYANNPNMPMFNTFSQNYGTNNNFPNNNWPGFSQVPPPSNMNNFENGNGYQIPNPNGYYYPPLSQASQASQQQTANFSQFNNYIFSQLHQNLNPNPNNDNRFGNSN
jgi:hypothetical protein